MWMQVIFDLPVGTSMERKNATDFRNYLLDEGFEMEQFSVYFRYCSDKNSAKHLISRIEKNLPPSGSVKILMFTDKQYANIHSYNGPIQGKPKLNPAQLVLF